MARAHLIICDHCDQRQNVDYPPDKEIDVREICVEISYPGTSHAGATIRAELCLKCRGEMIANIRTNSQQIPKAA